MLPGGERMAPCRGATRNGLLDGEEIEPGGTAPHSHRRRAAQGLSVEKRAWVRMRLRDETEDEPGPAHAGVLMPVGSCRCRRRELLRGVGGAGGVAAHRVEEAHQEGVHRRGVR
jgi:hypothetical protein